MRLECESVTRMSDSRYCLSTATAWRALPLAVLLAANGCATPNAIKDGTAVAVTPVADLPNPDPRLSVPLEEAYYIGPSDKIDTFVYQLPDMTRTVEVDSAGEINLPFVGAIKVAGKTATQVKAEIADRLAQDFLQNPDVTVSVANAASRRVTIEGAVALPGIYPLPGRITLLQAVSLARGTNTVANERVVAIFRTVDGQRMAAVFDLKMIRRGELADPPVYGNDVIVVEQSRGKVLLRDVIGTLPLLGVFRTVSQF